MAVKVMNQDKLFGFWQYGLESAIFFMVNVRFSNAKSPEHSCCHDLLNFLNPARLEYPFQNSYMVYYIEELRGSMYKYGITFFK